MKRCPWELTRPQHTRIILSAALLQDNQTEPPIPFFSSEADHVMGQHVHLAAHAAAPFSLDHLDGLKLALEVSLRR